MLLLAMALLAGIAFRIVALDRLPGINGDEAWYAVNVNELLHGGTPFLRTPSGNVVNPVHSLPLLLISPFVEPSFAILRVPSVLWGILTIVLAYPLLARPLGRRPAWIAAALLAVSPTAIGYARLGWDPSGAPFVCLLALVFGLRDRPLLAIAGSLVALLVHPTNVFVSPMVAASWAPHARRRYLATSEPTRRKLRIGAAALIVASIPPALMFVTGIARMGRLPSLDMVIERTLSPQAWFDLTLAMIRLFSGVTAATYLAGPMPKIARNVADAVITVALVVPIAIGWRAFKNGLAGLGSWLLAGLVVSVVAFQIVAGPVAIEPGLERYAMGMLVPLAIVCGLGVDALISTSRPMGMAVGGVTVVCLLAVLLGSYFHPLETRGGDAHPTFRTGRVEPKAAAYAYIRGASTANEVVSIFADDWWIYWPLRYLAFPERGRIFVEMIGNTPPIYPPGVAPPPYPKSPDKVYAVVFDQGAAWVAVRNVGRLLFTAVDPIGRPILHVVALTPNAPIPFVATPPWQKACC